MLSGVLPFEVIQEHPDLAWDFRGVSVNLTLDLSYVLANPDKDWIYPNICRYNKNVDTILRDASMWQKLDGFTQEYDVWWYVSLNKHITIEIIKNMRTCTSTTWIGANARGSYNGKGGFPSGHLATIACY